MGAGMNVAELRAKIRDIKDFPTEGILFKDITTLLKDGPAFRAVVDMLAERYAKERVDVVVGIESRGFIFAGAVAHQLGAGFVPVRKLGKLPGKTIEVEYELEYGRDALAVHEDAAADEVKPPLRASMLLDLTAPRAQSRDTAYQESLRAEGPAPVRRGLGEVQEDGSVRYGDVSVTVRNPCPPGTHYEPAPLPGRRSK